MSMPALLEATRSHLRQNIPELPERAIDVQLTGQPPPSVGDIYIAIHPLDWRPGDLRNEMMMGLDETYKIGITVTMRTTRRPLDRKDEILLDQWYGIEAWSRKVVALVHQNYEILTEATALILERFPASGTSLKIQEPFRWEGSDAAPKSVDGLWFTAVPDKDCGLTLTAIFGRARRLQASGSVV